MDNINNGFIRVNETGFLTGAKEFENGKMYYFKHPAIGDEKENAEHWFVYNSGDNWAAHVIPAGYFEKNISISKAMHFIAGPEWFSEIIVENRLPATWIKKCFISECGPDEEKTIKKRFDYVG